MHAIGYVINTIDLGITFGGKLRVPLGLTEMPEYFEESRGIYGAADSSWGKQPLPYGGHAVMGSNAALVWKASAFKTVVPDSTAEAETAEASRATKSIVFVRTVRAGIRRAVVGATLLLGDNSAMMDIVKKDGTTQRTRYFERSTMLVKYAVMRLLIATRLVATADMIADIFTKAVDKETFVLMRSWLLNTDGDSGQRAAYSRVAKLAAALQKAMGML